MTTAKKTKKGTVPCVFVSEWDDNITIRAKATYDPKTGEVELAEVKDVDGLEILTREYIELEDGDELEVCTDCHEYVLRTAMNPGIGHDLNEEEECPNPDCPSRG